MDIILNHNEKARIANNVSKDTSFIDIHAEPRNGVNTTSFYTNPNHFTQVRTDGIEVVVFSFATKAAFERYPFGAYEDWDIIFESARH